MEEAKECIDSLDIGMSEKEKIEMKGVLNIMFDKDNSELLTVEEYNKLQNKKHEEEFEFFKKELLKLEKEESCKETQRNIVINLNKKNISLDVIAEVCNLSLDKVKSIISTYCNN